MESKNLGYEASKVRHGYGQIWASWQTFSSLERIFGAHVVARRRDLIVREVLTKVAPHNEMLRA